MARTPEQEAQLARGFEAAKRAIEENKGKAPPAIPSAIAKRERRWNELCQPCGNCPDCMKAGRDARDVKALRAALRRGLAQVRKLALTLNVESTNYDDAHGTRLAREARAARRVADRLEPLTRTRSRRKP